jgi:hypothetical protein
MHGPINVKFPNNTIKWQIEFDSAFKALNRGVLQCSLALVVSMSSPEHETCVTNVWGREEIDRRNSLQIMLADSNDIIMHS